MSEKAQAAALLKEWDKILVMSHASPDGDTLGSAAALLRGLVSLGKQVKFFCADPVPEKFSYLFEGLPLGEFEPDHVMTVDVADKALLGKTPQELVDRVELAIDHHGTHVPFAQTRWVEPEAAATVEMIYALLEELGVEIDQAMADCLYTGLTTDTGCFRYRNVTPRTHRIAGALLELGARGADINRAMFESKTKGQVEAERLVMDTMEFYWEGKCALIQVPLSIFPQTGVKESDLDGLASLPWRSRGGAGRHSEGERGGKVKVSLGPIPGGRFPALRSFRRRRASGSSGLFPGDDFGRSPADHGTGLRGISERIGTFVTHAQGQPKGAPAFP